MVIKIELFLAGLQRMQGDASKSNNPLDVPYIIYLRTGVCQFYLLGGAGNSQKIQKQEKRGLSPRAGGVPAEKGSGFGRVSRRAHLPQSGRGLSPRAGGVPAEKGSGLRQSQPSLSLAATRPQLIAAGRRGTGRKGKRLRQSQLSRSPAAARARLSAAGRRIPGRKRKRLRQSQPARSAAKQTRLSAQEEQKPSASGKTSGDTGRHPRRGRRCPLHGGAAPRAAEQTAPPLCPTDTKSRSPSPKKS